MPETPETQGRDMPRDVLIAIAAGLTSALLYLSTAWSPLGALALALLAPLPLFAAGLALGFAAGAIATAVAAGAVGAVVGVAPAGLYLAADAMPALLIARFALLNRTAADGSTEWYPPGLLLTWLTLYCAGAFVVLAAAMGGGPNGIEAEIAGYLKDFRNMLAQSATGDGNVTPALDRMIAGFARVFPFVVVTWWIALMTLNGVVAQKVLVRTGHARRPTPDFRATALPGWLFRAVVAAAALALVTSGWPGLVATNLALILCVPYFLTGLAVLHAISGGWPGRTAILIALYLLLVLFGWPVLAVTGLGMVEHWAGLRQRFGGAGPGPGQGNERNE